jgi:hypothetical protein
MGGFILRCSSGDEPYQQKILHPQNGVRSVRSLDLKSLI